MSLDCQRLMIAFLAISLKLFIWARETDEANANRANERSSGPQQSAARQAALRKGVELETHLVEGEEVDAIVRFLAHYKTDLLVIGLHPHQSHISRLWSTVYALAQDAPCSVLGVH